MCIYVPVQMSPHSVVAISPPPHSLLTQLFLLLSKCLSIDLGFFLLFSSLCGFLLTVCFSHRKVTTEGQGLVKYSADIR